MRSKRLLALICVFCCLLSFSIPALAVTTESSGIYAEAGVSALRLTYIADASSRLSIRNSVATVSAYVRGYSSLATKSEITVDLQVRSGLIWKTVATWSDSQDGYRASVYETASVTAGKSYRTVATATVWSGTSSESITMTSETVVA